MDSNQVYQLLNQMSTLSYEQYGSFSFCAGFYQQIVYEFLTGITTKEDAIRSIETWINNNQQPVDK